MRYTFRKNVIVFLLFVLYLYLDASDFFTDAGSFQIGGEIAFISEGFENREYRVNRFILSPILNVFPINYFFIGPAVSLMATTLDSRNSISVNLGGTMGFAYGKDIPVIPFLYCSPQYLLHALNGFGINITGGIILQIQKHFSINFGPSFWLEVFEGSRSNTISIRISVTGLIF